MSTPSHCKKTNKKQEINACRSLGLFAYFLGRKQLPLTSRIFMLVWDGGCRMKLNRRRIWFFPMKHNFFSEDNDRFTTTFLLKRENIPLSMHFLKNFALFFEGKLYCWPAKQNRHWLKIVTGKNYFIWNLFPQLHLFEIITTSRTIQLQHFNFLGLQLFVLVILIISYRYLKCLRTVTSKVLLPYNSGGLYGIHVAFFCCCKQAKLSPCVWKRGLMVPFTWMIEVIHRRMCLRTCPTFAEKKTQKRL